MVLSWVSWYAEKIGGRKEKRVFTFLIIMICISFSSFFLFDLGKIFSNWVVIILGITLEHSYVDPKLNT